jgi:hypothetical protein
MKKKHLEIIQQTHKKEVIFKTPECLNYIKPFRNYGPTGFSKFGPSWVRFKNNDEDLRERYRI